MAASQRELISVVMPVYGEASHIGEVLADVRSRLEELGERFEFVLIDDGSPDKTWAALEAESSKHPMLRAARLSRNFGKELALTAGLDLARGDGVIVMDADGQHPPSLLPEMLTTWREKGVDIVEAVKSDRGKESLFSKLGAGVFYSLWSRFSGFDIRGASDFKLLNRRAVEAYLQMDERNVFFRGMTAWIGFDRVQIPFEVASRAGGRSNWSVFKKLRLAVNGISGFSSIPLQLVTFVGIAFLIFSLVFSVYTLVLQLTGHSVSGFATVILLLLIIGSLLMISLGIIGIYVARIYDEIKRRPRYLVSRTIDTKE
ncbi:MAG: glycosyltransferase family 2 protein [Pyrinomonadaceae bacterium]|nr:glycosyltransferase family 2 protein [Pyrinomonadaceae bacterium]